MGGGRAWIGKPILRAVKRDQDSALLSRLHSAPGSSLSNSETRGGAGLRGWGRGGGGAGAGRELRSWGGSRRRSWRPPEGALRPRPSLHAPRSSGRQWPLRAPGSRPSCPPVAWERPPKPAELGSWRHQEVGARGAMTPGGGGSPGESPGRGYGASRPRPRVTPGRERGGLRRDDP